MRLALAAAFLLASTALVSAQGLPGSEYQTLQCKVFSMGCKPPLPVVTPAADEPEEEQQAAPPPKKVAKVKRKPKPKPKVSAPADAPAAK